MVDSWVGKSDGDTQVHLGSTVQESSTCVTFSRLFYCGLVSMSTPCTYCWSKTRTSRLNIGGLGRLQRITVRRVVKCRLLSFWCQPYHPQRVHQAMDLIIQKNITKSLYCFDTRTKNTPAIKRKEKIKN